MYLNEEDAKKKCCPVMTRIDKNEPAASDKIIECIASNCIMWRWRINMQEPYSQGYCGLASNVTNSSSVKSLFILVLANIHL